MCNEDEPNTEAGAVAQVVQDLYGHEIETIDHEGISAPIAIVPQGMNIVPLREYLEPYRAAPERIQGTAVIATLDSFVEHVKRFSADDKSALFANIDPPSLAAVYDYHAKDQPRFARHRARYTFPVSSEWRAWTGNDGKSFSQKEFAQFIEDRILDVLDPADAGESQKHFAAKIGARLASPAQLLELSRGLKVNVKYKVNDAVNLSNGEIDVRYETKHVDDAGQSLRVPSAFLIAIPVFRSGDAYKIPVRLRYSLESGSIAWSFALYQPERLVEDAVSRACTQAKEATGLPLFYGAPEA